MANGKVREVARKVVLERTTKRWNRIHPTGFLGKLLRPLFGSADVGAIFVVEYDSVDESQMICEGNALDAWCLDDQGNRQIAADSVETGPAQGNIWHRQLVAFAVHADDTMVLVNEWDGPGNGRLIRYTVQTDSTGINLKFHGASSVVGGSAIG